VPQALLYLALYSLGVAVCLAIGPRRRPALCCALGFPVGMAALVPPVLLLTVAGVPYRGAVVAAVGVAIAAAAGWRIRRRGTPDRRSMRVLGLGTLAFAACAIPLSAVSFAVFTFDSHDIIINARVLADDAGFGRGLMYEMGDRGPFLLIIHSLAAFVRVDHLFGLAPLLGLSFVASFVLIAWHGFGKLGVPVRRRALPIALVAAALSTVWLWQFHLLYIHENMPSAVYLFLFAGLFWLAEIDDDRDGLPIACLALLAFALQRIENPLAVVLFGALALLPSRLPVRPLLPWLSVYTGVVIAWSLALIARLPTHADMSLSRTVLALMIVVTVALHGAWLLSRLSVLARVRRHATLLIAAVTLLALAATFAVMTDDMVESTRAMRINLTRFADWGVVWIGLTLLAVAGRFAVAPPAAQLFSWGTGLYFAFILMLTYGHGGPYVTTTFDSGIRMALHVLPMLCFYVGLQLALLSAPPRPAHGTSVPA
jgi:hypothetical protein